jgi:hypothetical protein
LASTRLGLFNYNQGLIVLKLDMDHYELNYLPDISDIIPLSLYNTLGFRDFFKTINNIIEKKIKKQLTAYTKFECYILKTT